MKKFFVLSALMLMLTLGLNAQNKVVAKYVDNPKMETVKISKDMLSAFFSQYGLNELLEDVSVDGTDGAVVVLCRNKELSKTMCDEVLSSVQTDKKYVELYKMSTTDFGDLIFYAKKKGDVYREMLFVANTPKGVAVMEFVGKFTEKK